MSIHAKMKWQKPVELFEPSEANCRGCEYKGNCNLTYCCEGENIPEKPGVYVFGRQHGQSITPIYIGESKDISQRIWEHLEGYVELMNALRKVKLGSRVILVGILESRFTKDTLGLIEGMLIEHALDEGFGLLNVSKTNPSYHEVSFSGNRESMRIFPKTLYRLVN